MIGKIADTIEKYLSKIITGTLIAILAITLPALSGAISVITYIMFISKLSALYQITLVAILGVLMGSIVSYKMTKKYFERKG